MDIKEIRRINLAKLIGEFDTAADFAEAVDTSPSYISQIMSKKTAAEVGDRFARKIEQKRGLPRGWMDHLHEESVETAIAGSRPAESNVSTPPRPIRAWDGHEELGDEYVTIPRLDLRASCGNGNVAWHIDEKGQPQAFRRAWCDRLGIDTQQSATIVAEGDSMADRIQDGDSLVVDPTKRQLLDGKVYLICYDGEHFVKRIFKVPGMGLRIVSDNPDKARHPDWEVAAEDAESLTILGRVMGVSGGL